MAFSLADTECCECILRIRPSSVRVAFTELCEYLNTTVWAVLCRYFLQIKFLQDSDMKAISDVLLLNRPTPSQEMILRLENQKDMTIGMLLRHIRCACLDLHFKHIASLFSPLHTKSCPVYSVTSQYFCPISLQWSGQAPISAHETNAPVSLNNSMTRRLDTAVKNHISHGICRTSESTPSMEQSLRFESMNNLSDPFKPYLAITQHPTSESLPEGDVLVLKCMAESDASITYSWRRNGKVLKEHNDKVLMIQDVQYTDSGNYVCIANTETLEVLSDVAKVTVARINDSMCSQTAGYFATEKYALLIANEQYKYNPKLSSASNDALAIATTLRELGFKTVTMVNMTLDEMGRAVGRFCDCLRNGAYCVTYLAGHGFENDGQCYIVPVDAPKHYTAEHCFSIKLMIEQIRSSHDLNLAVFLLDVCRKRLKRNDSIVRPNSSCTKSGNFVISYATMEHGMAFEVKGHDLGVYASSLINHLKKDKRVTRVIELAHGDIHQNGVTRGIQRPEFNSNIFEDRKLTDPVYYENVEEYDLWYAVHVEQKPNIYVFECGVDVILNKTCPFSNQFLLEAKIAQSGHASINVVALISLKGHKGRQSFLIDNIQRLNNSELIIELQLQSADGGIIDRFEDSVRIPFAQWWRNSR